jgi:hypothetical protein
MWLRITKITAYLVCLALFVSSLAALHNLEELRLMAQFQSLTLVDPTIKAKELAEKGEVCQAIDYMKYFLEYEYVRDNPQWMAFYRELQTRRESLAYIGENLGRGVLFGSGPCVESSLTATISDFLVIGDIRDFVGESMKYVTSGAAVDPLTMTLAGAGILLTFPEIITLGGAAGVKATVSGLKLANKLGKLSSPMKKSLVVMFDEAAKSRDIKKVAPLVNSIYRVSAVPGLKMRDLVAILGKARSVEDLKLLEKVAAGYGRKTAKFLDVGGQTAVTVAKRFSGDKRLVEAMDEAVKYGAQGPQLLGKTGPTKFMKYLTYTKYAARGTRSIHKGRLQSALLGMVAAMPAYAIMAVALITGLVSIGAPAYRVYSWKKKRA